MDLRGRHYKKPMMEIVSFEKFNVVSADADQMVLALDTSRHQNFVILLNTKDANGIKYRLESANIDSNGNETAWTILLAEATLLGDLQFVISRQCVSERVRMIIKNDVPGSNATLDIFIRLNPFGTIV